MMQNASFHSQNKRGLFRETSVFLHETGIQCQEIQGYGEPSSGNRLQVMHHEIS